MKMQRSDICNINRLFLEVFDETTEAINRCDNYAGGSTLNLAHLHLTALPDNVPVHVSGDFYCSNNNLTQLSGAPGTVDGTFGCSSNKLTSLKGSPRVVGGDFYCIHNRIQSLEGAPESIGGYFECDQFTDKQYREYIERKKYKQTATKDVDTDLGFDDLLDVL